MIVIKYLSLFSGIGAFEKALKNNSIDYELVGFSEIDKYATKSYCAVHGVDESLNLGDVSKIDLDKLKKIGGIDLITHGSPCQDFSIAGRLAGGDKGSGTRSSLMWCTVDIVEAVKPKYVVWENVKNLLSAKNRHNFDGYLEIMDKLGYNSYYKILNAKNYGIPQNRERVFTISIRKDLGLNYEFPVEIELTKKLKDGLEKNVDEKYYLSDKLIAGLIANTERQKAKGNGFAFETTDGDGVAKTVTTRVGACRSGDNYIQVVGKLDIKGHDCVKRVYSGEGIAPTLTDMQGGNRQPKIIIDEPVIAASRGRNPDNPGDRTPGIPTEQRLEINKQGISNTITTVQKDNYVIEPRVLRYERTEFGKAIRKKYEKGEVQLKRNEMRMLVPRKDGISNTITTVQKDNYVIEPCLKIKEATKAGYKEAHAGDGVNISGRMKYQRGNVQKEMTQTLMANGSERGVVTPDMRIRKLTPRECWRLMGFEDTDFDKAQAVPTSDTQLYKQAGNSIVVKVLEAVFKNLFGLKEKKSWYK